MDVKRVKYRQKCRYKGEQSTRYKHWPMAKGGKYHFSEGGMVEEQYIDS